MDEPEEYISVAKAAEEVGLASATIHSKIQKEQVQGYKFDHSKRRYVPHHRGDKKPLELFVLRSELRQSMQIEKIGLPGRPRKKV